MVKYRIKKPDGSEVIISKKEKKKFCDEYGIRTDHLSHTDPKHIGKPTHRPVAWSNTGGDYYILESWREDDEESPSIIKEVGSEVERKPKFEDFGDYYLIYSSRKDYRITKDELRRLKKLYCARNFNINQICLEMDMLRDEFFLVKNAFSIVKTDTPFIDDDIDELTPDEMAENTRREKKRAYFRKLDENKFADMEKELKKLHQKEYYYKIVGEKLKEIKIDPLDNVTIVETCNKKEAVLDLADIHAGMSHNSPFNTYNKDVMAERLRTLTTKVISKFKELKFETLHILNLGDAINGAIHVSGRVLSDMDVIESTKELTKQLLIMLRSLCSVIPNIKYYQIGGNHSRMLTDKTANIESENFANIVTWYLSAATSDWDNLEIVENKISEIIDFNVFNKKIIGLHGHEGGLSKIKDIQQFWVDKINEIHLGHYHNHQTKEFNTLKFTVSPSFCGVGEYAKSKLLYSEPMQLLHIYEESGDKSVYELYL